MQGLETTLGIGCPVAENAVKELAVSYIPKVKRRKVYFVFRSTPSEYHAGDKKERPGPGQLKTIDAELKAFRSNLCFIFSFDYVERVEEVHSAPNDCT